MAIEGVGVRRGIKRPREEEDATGPRKREKNSNPYGIPYRKFSAQAQEFGRHYAACFQAAEKGLYPLQRAYSLFRNRPPSNDLLVLLKHAIAKGQDDPRVVQYLISRGIRSVEKASLIRIARQNNNNEIASFIEKMPAFTPDWVQDASKAYKLMKELYGVTDKPLDTSLIKAEIAKINSAFLLEAKKDKKSAQDLFDNRVNEFLDKLFTTYSYKEISDYLKKLLEELVNEADSIEGHKDCLLIFYNKIINFSLKEEIKSVMSSAQLSSSAKLIFFKIFCLKKLAQYPLVAEGDLSVRDSVLLLDCYKVALELADDETTKLLNGFIFSLVQEILVKQISYQQKLAEEVEEKEN